MLNNSPLAVVFDRIGNRLKATCRCNNSLKLRLNGSRSRATWVAPNNFYNYRCQIFNGMVCLVLVACLDNLVSEILTLNVNVLSKCSNTKH